MMVNSLQAYMDQLSDDFDLSKIVDLPEYPLKIGNIQVINNNIEDSNLEDYFIISDKIEVTMQSHNITGEHIVDDGPVKEYTFMLILPKDVIQDKLDKVNNSMTNQIFKFFVTPFLIMTLILMMSVSCCIKYLSTHITRPIIELHIRIKQII